MGNEVLIHIKGKDDASSVIGGVENKAKGLGSALGGVAKIAGGFIVAQGIMKLGGFLMDAADAAKEDQASVQRLQQAYKNAEGGVAGFTGWMDKAVQAGQDMAFSDDQIRDSLSMLVAQTGSATEAQKRLALAQDLSRGANIDLVTASRLLGKVTDENVSVLARYGIAAKKGMTETELFGMLQQKFGGQATAFADSTAGAMERSQIKMGELKETIGYAVLPIMTALASFVADKLIPAAQELADTWIPRITSAFNTAKETLQPLIDKLGEWIEVLQKNKDVSMAASAVIGGVLVGAFIALAVAAGTAAVGVIAATWPFIAAGVAIAAVIAIIVLAIKRWDDITEAFRNASVPLKALIVVLGLILAPILAPIVALASLGVAIKLLATNWKTIWDGMKTVAQVAVNSIIEIIAKVIDAFSGVLGFIASVVNKIPDWVPGISRVKDALNSASGATAGWADQVRGLKVDLVDSAGAMSMWESGLRQVLAMRAAYYNDTALLLNRADVANISIPANAPPIDTGGGAAEEVFRGLDADLAALRAQMIATAEEGVGRLNWAIEGEEHVLEGLGTALEAAQKQHADLETQLQSATDAMNGWQNASLRGTDAFSDTQERFARSMDQLQLKINNLELKKLGMKEGSDGVKEIDLQIKALNGDMDELRLKASNAKLSENLALDPLKQQLAELFNPVKEYTFDQIVAGWKEAKAKVDEYGGSILTLDAYMAQLEDSQKRHQTILDTMKTAYTDLQTALDTGINAAIKEAWDARGGDDIIKSIEEAFAAIDRGDKSAADAAMASALSLWDEIKALVPGAETGIFAPLEKVLKDAETSINVDVTGMSDKVTGAVGTVATGVATGLGAVQSTLKDVVAFYLEAVRNRADIIIDRLNGLPSYLVDIVSAIANISIPSAQGGASVIKAGLLNVHAKETVVPEGDVMVGGGRGGGDTHIHMHVQGSILSERDIEKIIADAFRHGKYRGLVTT